jgi:hypothetical protein
MPGNPVNDPLVGHSGAGVPGNWYNTSWKARKPWTVDNTKVSGSATLTDFPVLIDRTITDFQKAQTDGDDFVITSSDGTTKIPHEIEKWDDSTGELVLHFKEDVAHNTDTEGFIYYDNPSATNQEDITNVWSSAYKCVQHFHDNFLDSTSNDNDGTNNGSTNATGMIADGQSFDGSNDDVSIPDDASLKFATPNRITVMVAFNPTNFTSLDKIISKANTVSPFGPFEMRLSHDSSFDELDATLATGSTEHLLTGTTTLSTGTWYIAHLTYDGSTIRFYIDGNEEDSISNSDTISDSTTDLTIGRHPSFGQPFDGLIDEVRIMDVARNADWISTEIENLKNNATFITFGTEETIT